MVPLAFVANNTRQNMPVPVLFGEHAQVNYL